MAADVCVIMPTIRDYGCTRDYVANARAHGFETERLHVVLVTESSCDTEAMQAMLDEEGVTGQVFDGPARERWFAEHGIEAHSSLIPARSHAQTSFGLLYLWANDFDYGVFLDDDTRPLEEQDFFGTHLQHLAYEGEVEQVRSDRHWVNVLYRHDDQALYPRGYPYSAMGETIDTGTTTVADVVASQGLWTKVPDLDAVRILQDGSVEGRGSTRLDEADYGPPFVAARGQYLTVCSMNLAFRREVVPAFYQLPMDDNPWGVGRFDDIWSGVFLKRACDLLGKEVINGDPLCIHDKVPRSTFGDLAAEAPGLELNEHLWTIVDDVGDGATTFAEAYAAMADELATGTYDYENGAFLNYVGECMREWLDCLEALQPGTVHPPTAATADLTP